MSLIKVSQLSKSFSKGFIPRKVSVLKSLSFEVFEGRITGFLGGNGAGKTTTMKCLLGLIFPDEGEIELLGKSPQNIEIRKEIGFLPEKHFHYDHLSGEEFLRFHGELSGKLKSSEIRGRITDLLKKLDLEEARAKRLRQYSKGMLQKIGLAQAVIHRPSLVVLDEPMSGLDPDGRYYVTQVIEEVKQQGAGVFFSSHLLPDVEKICRDLVVLKEGQLLFSGSLEGFLSEVEKKYSIKYVENGEFKERVVKQPSQLQIEIAALVKDRKEIVEVRSVRPSLEQVFVTRAQKVNREVN
ncbi:MAG: ABC transporter ATP-binding protein [Bdellovibrionales bacterium]|nr:ABC transporter ATP-binding protein [Bdellovibrionales bacterium]